MHAHAVGRGEKRHPDKRLPHTGEGAQFAPKLSARYDAVIKRQCLSVNHQPVAVEKRVQRDHCVVNQRVRWDGLGQASAHGIDAAGSAEYGIDQRMLLARPDFVSPININVGSLSDAVGMHKSQFAGDCSNGLVGKVRNQVPQRLRVKRLTHVGKEQQLSRGLLHGDVERGGLSGVGGTYQAHVAMGI